MEEKLKTLFDYQKFRGNEKLSRLIDGINGCSSFELSDDELSLVNAAGDIYTSEDEKNKKNF